MTQGLEDLTGGIGYKFDLTRDEADRGGVKQWIPKGEVPERLWDEVMEKMKTEHVVGCTCSTKGEPRPQTEKKGILVNRTYCMVTGGDFEDNKLMRLRIPLDESGEATEWNGKWSDDSAAWNSRLRQMLHFSKSSSDGTFWIEYADFCKHFTKVYMCRMLDDLWTRFAVKSRWMDETVRAIPRPPMAPPSAPYSAAAAPPQASTRVDKTCLMPHSAGGRLHQLHLMAQQQPVDPQHHAPKDQARHQAHAARCAQVGGPRPALFECHRLPSFSCIGGLRGRDASDAHTRCPQASTSFAATRTPRTTSGESSCSRMATRRTAAILSFARSRASRGRCHSRAKGDARRISYRWRCGPAHRSGDRRVHL